MSRPRWFVALVRAAFPGRFVAARATRLPVFGGLLDRWLFGGDHIVYLPRDGVIPVGEGIEAPGEMALPSAMVEQLIRQAKTRWIMDACICRQGNHCQDYPRDLGCLFLGEAAAGINPKLGRPVSEAEALAHVARSREVGLVHMVGRNKLDTLWLGVGPGQRLLTICNCCPCCCLWRVLPHVAPQIGAKVQALPGVRLAVTDRCAGCGACTDGVCFVEAIRLEGGRAVIGPDCRGCGRCAEVCPRGAIELTIEDEDFLASALEALSGVVDVT
jgi:ferredoxin